MDLKKEILAVLDNPASVWESIVNNFSNETRISLMVLTTYKTPVDVVDWQGAVARVSLEAAAKFEAALRVLDDVFIGVNRDARGKHMVSWRNPSMDDFCALHLDRNVGFAISVAGKSPSLSQVQRLFEMASASRGTGQGRQVTHPNMRAALVTEPALLLERLLGLLPQTPEATELFMEVATLILQLIAADDLLRVDLTSEVRARLAPVISTLSFEAHTQQLYLLLDDRAVAKTLPWLLQAGFERFYDSVAASAYDFGHFDSLVNLDEALGRDAESAAWADAFLVMSSGAIHEEYEDVEDMAQDRDYYDRIAEHLDLGERSRIADWEEAVREAELASSSPNADMDDDGWRDSPTGSGTGGSLAFDHQQARIDSLFAGLSASRSR